jgi:hypothetical protein
MKFPKIKPAFPNNPATQDYYFDLEDPLIKAIVNGNFNELT